MPLMCSAPDCERRAARRHPDHHEQWVCTWHPDRIPPPRKGDVYVAPEPEKKAKTLPAAPLPTAPFPDVEPDNMPKEIPAPVTPPPAPALASSSSARDAAAEQALDDVTTAPQKQSQNPTRPLTQLPRDVELLLNTAAAHPDATLAKLAGHARTNLVALIERLARLTQQDAARRAAEAARAQARAAAEQAVADARAALAAAEAQLAETGPSSRAKDKTALCGYGCGKQLAPQGRKAHERSCAAQPRTGAA